MKHLSCLASAALAASLAFALGAGGAQAAPTCPDGAIRIGSVSTITGPVDFSDGPKGAKAVFDQLNAAGGLNGCKVDYTMQDDKGDPQVAAQAARDLIDNKNVVALAGGTSLIDCVVNAGTYKRNQVMSVQGVGVDPMCFNAPTIAPVNVGPYTLTTAMLNYADTVLKDDRLCAFFIIIGGTQEAYGQAVKRWEAISGKKIHLIDMTLPLQGDLTPYLIKARNAGCKAVLTNQVEPGVVQMINTADAQKIAGIDWVFLASGFTEGVAKALPNTRQPVYAGTEWEPFTEANAANAEWIAAMEKAGQPKTAFSQGGYLAARVMLDTIAAIDGPVTREAVTAKLAEGKPMPYAIAGSPYVFGEAARHAPMQAIKVMQLSGGKWVPRTADWFVLPDAK